jgi:hypothetical protein
MCKDSQHVDCTSASSWFSCARWFLYLEPCEEYLVSDLEGVCGGQRCQWSGGNKAIRAKRTEGSGCKGTHVAGGQCEWFLSR